MEVECIEENGAEGVEMVCPLEGMGDDGMVKRV